MIKMAIVRDNCGALIADGISANELRLYRRREGKDLCLAYARAPRWLPTQETRPRTDGARMPPPSLSPPTPFARIGVETPGRERYEYSAERPWHQCGKSGAGF